METVSAELENPQPGKIKGGNLYVSYAIKLTTRKALLRGQDSSLTNMATSQRWTGPYHGSGRSERKQHGQGRFSELKMASGIHMAPATHQTRQAGA